ncbi:hypothetical protein GCM10027275_10810 [Rhabdobacter roseus]|uniref:DUF3298 domain-containing protein n=1 Tax=Rhabdobacter roseus TaxID=1655419 RepID=A0A840TSL0_9BACT|nr:DUF3298 and DUF4163 domain-containing protein [Rhabdobacter roseus]MBB5282990.1 hypothetical protein [Rhabdobacter roseus]
MKQHLAALCLLSTLLAGACRQANQDEESTQRTGITFENATRQGTEVGSCDTANLGGAMVSVDLLMPADSGKATQALRKYLQETVVRLLYTYSDSAYQSTKKPNLSEMENAGQAFMASYRDFHQENPDAPGCWAVEMKGDTVATTPKLIVYSLDQYSFTGGAHPNSFLGYYLFDAQTGQHREWQTYVSDTVALYQKAEAAFRKLEEIPADANLEEQGYFLRDHVFFLPANVAFTREGVLFHYNPYEIAAYARGPISFTVPYAELEGVVKRELLF